MDSVFLAEVAVGIIAFDPDGGALDARLFARHQVEDLGCVAFLLGVAKVHPDEVLGPVLGFRPAGSRMDGQDGVAGVVGLGEEGLELGLGQALGEGGQALPEFRIDGFALLGQLQQNVDLLFLGVEGGQELNFLFQALFDLLQGLRFLLVLPDLGRGELLGQALKLGFLAGQVKENLAALRIWRSCLGSGFRVPGNARRRRRWWGSWVSLFWGS